MIFSTNIPYLTSMDTNTHIPYSPKKQRKYAQGFPSALSKMHPSEIVKKDLPNQYDRLFPVTSPKDLDNEIKYQKQHGMPTRFFDMIGFQNTEFEKRKLVPKVERDSKPADVLHSESLNYKADPNPCTYIRANLSQKLSMMTDYKYEISLAL
ncbi:hypothetical protein ROZALSC1DRAFT_25777 [Rozella allomycis CSF55]|uniref:Uncharacterized protein n=1 Tax=Rozella allomycis (strain CSF55) TaxID=988480 RepID=A0A4P9YAY0_ROZAC|nr:hypothetical protein ROZALSC1DRAFT_25777 [Rozella allomycis CSF55]